MAGLRRTIGAGLLGRTGKKRRNTIPSSRSEGAASPGAAPDTPLGKDLEDNLRQLKAIFAKCDDIVFREFIFAQDKRMRLAIVYADGLVNRERVSDQIMRALALEVPMAAPGIRIAKAQALDFIRERGLCINQIKEVSTIQDVVRAVMSGETALLVDGHAIAIINAARGWEARSITEPEAEPTVRGPREAFVETMRVNTSLIRRIIRSPNLKIETVILGEVTGTDVVIVYIEGIANQTLVEEVKGRLSRIHVDAVLESGYVEELIQDNPWSLFPTVNTTERPDRVAAMLLEGRVAIIVDGTPFALTVPNLLVEYLQTPEDYYERFQFASAVRIIRFMSLMISLALPAVYVAAVSFHHELLPTTLLLSIAGQREGVPYPVLVEVFIMELMFEVLREAGIRLPRPLGQAISIVGALVMGDAAVRAGLVAASTVIVVAVTGIGSFVLAYRISHAFRLLRFMLLFLSAMFGLFGVISGLAVIVIHLCTLRSFGVPYLSPMIPTTAADLKDVVFRAPWWAMFTRPRLIVRQQEIRQEPDLKPAPPGSRSRVRG